MIFSPFIVLVSTVLSAPIAKPKVSISNPAGGGAEGES